MTDYAALCTAAGLTVRSVTTHGAQVCVCVARAPQSASGLQALAARLGVKGMTVSMGNGTGDVELWFTERGE